MHPLRTAHQSLEFGSHCQLAHRLRQQQARDILYSHVAKIPSTQNFCNLGHASRCPHLKCGHVLEPVRVEHHTVNAQQLFSNASNAFFALPVEWSRTIVGSQYNARNNQRKRISRPHVIRFLQQGFSTPRRERACFQQSWGHLHQSHQPDCALRRACFVFCTYALNLQKLGPPWRRRQTASGQGNLLRLLLSRPPPKPQTTMGIRN
jgi:hypothetical protein